MVPPTPGSNERTRSAELPGQSPLVHAELACHDRERRALFIPCGGEGNRNVGHRADDASSGDAHLVEVVDDGGPVDAVSTRESVDRGTLAVVVDQ